MNQNGTVTNIEVSDEILEKKIMDANNPDNVIDILDKLHPSYCYHVMHIPTVKQKLKVISDRIRKDDVKKYQLYQDIKMRAEKSFRHDNTHAKMIDVDRAVTKAYSILLGMISQLNAVVNAQSEAINRLERVTGINETNFYGGDEDDSKHEDVQRKQDNT